MKQNNLREENIEKLFKKFKSKCYLQNCDARMKAKCNNRKLKKRK